MSWEVTLAVLFAAAVHAGWNALVKHGRDPLLETTLIHAWLALPAWVVLMLGPCPGPTAMLCLAASTAVHCVYCHALAGAHRSSDPSFAYPIMRGSAPMFTALLGVVVLGERGATPRLAGIASMLAFGIALWAMTHAPVALVAALREASVLFALLIARGLLKERIGAMRWAGAASIVTGVLALRLA